MLEISIRKKIGSFSLSVDLCAERGPLALLGASGCGKSMTLKCIAGLVRPDEGRIVLNGRVLFDSKEGINVSPQKRRVGYLFQQYALFPNMTVAQNIGAALVGSGRSEKEAAVNEQIRIFHLEGLYDRVPAQLSGGQQQRVALARIFASRPEVILLDEPFTALDSYLKWQMEMELTDILSHYDGDVLFVSHDRNEVIRMCDKVCVLTEGKSGRTESVGDLMRSPGTVGAALISGCKNFSLADRIGDHRVLCREWGTELDTEDSVPEAVTAVGIRAHYLRPIWNAKEADIRAAGNLMPVRVERVITDAFSTIVMMKTPGGDRGRSLIRYEAEKGSVPSLSPDEELILHIPGEAVMPLCGEGLS